MDNSEPRSPVCLLVDNGSLQPAATLALRRIAADLSTKVGQKVEPVSLLHSSGIAPERLGGRRAEILESALRARYATGAREFLVVPLFFGPSAALTEYIPQRMAVLAKSLRGLSVRVAAPLMDARDPADGRVARIVAENVRAALQRIAAVRPAVVLVDHGSPQPAVGAVRDLVVAQLAAELGSSTRAVIAASMERREGAAFDFNEPLLERALSSAPLGDDAGDVIVAPLFFFPGRHAGPEGDIERICRAAETRHTGMRTHIAPLVAGHPLLVDVLADRFRAALAASSGS